jgi:hypothetical protein
MRLKYLTYGYHDVVFSRWFDNCRGNLKINITPSDQGGLKVVTVSIVENKSFRRKQSAQLVSKVGDGHGGVVHKGLSRIDSAEYAVRDLLLLQVHII